MLGNSGKTKQPSRALSLPASSNRSSAAAAAAAKGEGQKQSRNSGGGVSGAGDDDGNNNSNLAEIEKRTRPQQSREGLERSSSHSKLTRLRKTGGGRQRGSKSPPDSPEPVRRPSSMRSFKPRPHSPSETTSSSSALPRRQTSMRSLKSRPSSPSESPKQRRRASIQASSYHSNNNSPSASPVPKKPSSMRSSMMRQQQHQQQRPNSPVLRKKDLVASASSASANAESEPPPPTPMPKKAQRIRSPKGTHKTSSSQKRKSPRTPKKPAAIPKPKEEEDEEAISPYPALENDSDIDNDDQEDEDMPSLVDDSVVRDTMEAERGGKQWNIMEDTPAGHAEEKLAMVAAIENDDQSGDWGIELSEFLEEDDDIIEDEDEHSLAVARSRGLNSLPTDPSSATGSSAQLGTFAGRDRFAPAFNSQARWKDGANLDKEPPAIESAESADVSLISDTNEAEELESSIEIGNLNLPAEKETVVSGDEESGGNSRTPATTKRSGGRRTGRIKAAPDLDVESSGKGSAISSSTISEVQDLQNSPRQKPRRKKKSPPASSVMDRHEKKGSESTGRSSNQPITQRQRKARDALHSRNKKIPEVVPGSYDGVARSPMSSPSTSNQYTISPMTSSRSQQQQQSLNALQRHHGKKHNHHHSSSKRRPNSSLNHHVESGRDRSTASEIDEDTLGASTISTNFTTTQRTRGDTTVSERSLFRSDTGRSGSCSIPRIPQRRSEVSDSEGSDHEGENLPQQPTQARDRISAIQEAARAAESLFNRNLTVDDRPSGTEKELKTFLRRPSGDDDDLLAIADNTIQSASGSEDFSIESSNQGDGGRRSKAFLQINANNHGLVVESEVVDNETGELHKETLLHLDPVDSVNGRTVDESESGDIGVIAEETSEFAAYPALGVDGQPLEKVNEEAVVDLSTRIYGVGSSASPKGKKKGRLALFKKMASWKGKVTVDEEDEDK